MLRRRSISIAWSLAFASALVMSTTCSRKPTQQSTPPPPQELVESGETANEDRVLGAVPEFRLIDQAGSQFGLEELSGHVWVANFIFTRCTATCPQQSNVLAQLQSHLKADATENVRLLSITVDPEFDTPDVLERYANQYGADPEQWKFLTGSRDDIWRLSKDGFKLPVGESPTSAAMPIFHSPQFILVDAGGRIRGYFDSGKPEEVKRLEESVKALVSVELTANAAAEETAEVSYKPFPYPPDVRAPAWIAGRREQQLATESSFEVFTGFQFSDRSRESGIDFVHRSVDYACKINIAAHYDHGNGIAVADVDGDGLLDVYLSTQLGSNQLWRNQGGGRFTDATTPVISLAHAVGVSASFADTDNDGDADLYVTSVRDGNFFFENDGTGQFTDRTETSGLGYSGHSSSGTFFDFDRDGLLDLFLSNVGVYTTDHRDSQGIYPPLKDAFAGHLKPSERNERSILYRNLGDNRFADATEQLGLIDNSWTGDASPIDGNEDGWPDLYVVNMQGHDEYYENMEGKRFEKKSRERFPKTSWGAMGIQVFDFDNDGHMDIYITDMHSDMSAPIAVENEKKKSDMKWTESFLQSGGNSIFGNSFFRNQGAGSYEEISDQIGAENYWPWGLSTGDFNADGYEDVFVASSMNYPFRYCVNTLLLNNKGKQLLDSEYILGIEPRRGGRTARPNFTLNPGGADREHQLVERLNITEPVEVWGAMGSRSSVLFDVDNDGDVDIMTNEFNAGPMVLINDLADNKAIHWTKVKLVGTESNRSGLGAVVAIHAGNRTLTKLNDGKSGYLSQSALPLYFGLDDANQIDSIVVKWPSGKTQQLPGPMASNSQIEIIEQ